MPAGRTAGFSPAEQLDAAQRLEPAVFSPAEQADEYYPYYPKYTGSIKLISNVGSFKIDMFYYIRVLLKR
jgi:hypothetical protein